VPTYTGRVVDGKVVLDGEPPPEGTEVAVYIPGDNEPIALTTDMEAELEAAIERLDRGEYVTWEALREQLVAIEKGVGHAQN
jgi:hypothetical protein